MKIIDDSKMQELLASGMTQKQVAGYFKVSEQAVSKRLKKLRGFQEPQSFARLTEKEKLFALAKAEGKNNTEAAMIAYDCKDRVSGKALGHKHMKDPDITVAIQDLLHQEGIGRRKRVKRLRDMVLCQDLSVAGKGLDMANRMVGEYAPDRHEIDITESHIRNLIMILEGDTAELPSEDEAIDVK